MKKALVLLPAIMLAACDRPTSTAELSCDMDKANVLHLDGSYPDNEVRGTKVNISVTTYDNYATVTYENITTTFEKVAEPKYYGEFGEIHITYKGNFPGSKRTALLEVIGNIANRKIIGYVVTFIGEKEKIHEREFSPEHSCTPVHAEQMSKDDQTAAVPFNHRYKMPNKIEGCINKIVKKVYCVKSSDSSDKKCDFLMLYHNGKMLDLTKKDALGISANWDYNNIKLYQNDGKIEEHEKDACDVLNRLNKFAHDIGMDSERSEDYITLQREMASCDKCSRIIANGHDGDYIVQLPETTALKNITRAAKNTKFLSVSNPNQYARDGYCLVNVIPHDTMEKLDLPSQTCKYRIYCGAPEFMDYDQDYAIEVCQ